MEKPHLNVSAALIFNDVRDRLLIARRNPGGLHGDLWEFPGGKIEPGETPEDCLKREIREELGVEIWDIIPYISVHHEYDPFTLTLHTFSCQIAEGIPSPIGCRELRWIEIAELTAYSFPEADGKIISHLLKDFAPDLTEFPITDTLDLHTFRPRDVPLLVTDFITRCHEAGFCRIRIIHGKGTGTLRKIVQGILSRSPVVKSFSTAPDSAGGWGATIVELVRK